MRYSDWRIDLFFYSDPNAVSPGLTNTTSTGGPQQINSTINTSLSITMSMSSLLGAARKVLTSMSLKRHPYFHLEMEQGQLIFRRTELDKFIDIE
jgi:hypothetical protein